MTKYLLLFTLFLQPFTSFAAQDIATFKTTINELWSARNYSELLARIDNALQEDPSDLFALCLRQGYYLHIDQDFDLAQESSAALLAEMQKQLKQPTGPTCNLAKQVVATERPDPPPVNDQLNPERLEKLHQRFPGEFPFIKMHIDLCMHPSRYDRARDNAAE